MDIEWSRSLRSATDDDVPAEQSIFEVLRNRRRRYALHHLKRADGSVSVGDLAEHVAAWENERPPAEVSGPERKRVYISLVQSHLPVMEESGVVAVDEAEGTVRLTPAATDVDVYVELVPDRDIRWSEYYLGLSAFAGLFLLAAHRDLFVLDAVPPVGWLAFVVALFTLSAAVHVRYERRTRIGNPEEPPE